MDLIIKEFDPVWDSGIVGGTWLTFWREYSPNDEGLLDLSEATKIKFYCYPYNQISKMYIVMRKWDGTYDTWDGKTWYVDVSPGIYSWPPFTYMNTLNEWQTIEIDWADLEAESSDIKSNIAYVSLYFATQGPGGAGIKISSIWAEVPDDLQAFIG